MSRHPYIGFYRAKAIIDYRRLYGKINSLDDLKLNKHFTPEAIEKLKPYVMF
jgi:DNA uptake protein ComE-like DNA-binding protein